MIKKSPVQSPSRERISGLSNRSQRPRRPLAPLMIVAVAAVAAFFVGAHLREWTHRTYRIVPIDASKATFFASAATTSTLVVTPRHRSILITSDLNPTAFDALEKCLKQQKVASINVIILTSVSSDTAAGIIRLANEIPINGPIITPYQPSDHPAWWQRTAHTFNLSLKGRGLNAVSWTVSGPALAEEIPEVNISLFAPQRSNWEVPDIAVNITYQHSSLLDLTALTSRQTASISELPMGQGSRILVINGQDSFVSKELLSDVEPDVVILTGLTNLAPGSKALANVEAADSVPVTLTTTTAITATLPASNLEPIRFPVQ